MKTGKEEKLTVDNAVKDYSDKMILHALEQINDNTPFWYLVNLIDLMSDYITENNRIDEDTKSYFALLIQYTRFHLDLLKIIFWYKENWIE